MAQRALLEPEPSRQLEQMEARIAELERQVEALRREARASEQSFRQLEAIIDHSPMAIYLKDTAHAYVLVNREYERLANVLRSQIIGRTDFDFLPEPVARLFREQDLEVIARGGTIEFKETVQLHDGEHSFITSKFPLRSADGELVGVAGLCAEITELERARVRLEEAQSELVSRERLATLGELAAVVAHEVRNPLGIVFNSVASLRRTLDLDERSELLLGIISEEAERLNRMVGALLELGRPSPVNPGPTDVEDVVADAIEAARALADPTAEVHLIVPDALPPAVLDAMRLRYALINLVSNAFQAPNRRGPVTVRVDLEGGDLRFLVADDGEGVPPELRERIFAPFFTTRPTGTGLGLAVVRRVAEAHRGSATVRPTPGGGATFVLSIPLVPAT